jgi:nicotinamide-nucleotide amidase
MIAAEIVAIGTELLSPFRSDTNSLYLTRSLEEHGIRVVAKTIVGDEIERIVEAFRNAFQRADIILCSGGLGPTIDDLTRDALCEFLKIPMRLRPDLVQTLEERFRLFGRKMPESNLKQAMLPEGAIPLPNPNGSAPGIFLETKGKQIFLLPGPPIELEPMWEQYGLPNLKKDVPFERMIFRIAMLPESQVDEMLPIPCAMSGTRSLHHHRKSRSICLRRNQQAMNWSALRPKCAQLWEPGSTQNGWNRWKRLLEDC